MRLILILTMAVFLSSCATGSYIITGEKRPAISSSEVKVYLEPPQKYETIGIVEAASDVELSTQAAQDRVINELKKQASKIGANGVILLIVYDKSGDTYGFYSGNTFFASTDETKVAKGKAIFVINE
ncbi:MAG: hypothetical protein H8D56_24570 [Planctomycetes bacterium]|nr:hypothetical protein [Planctomycetota bacterium]